MKYLLLGADLQGAAIAFDLLRQAEGTTGLTVVDTVETALGNLAARLADDRLQTVVGKVGNEEAMARMTGFPAAIIARMLASKEITTRGACCQELIVSGDRMIAELERRQVAVEILNGKPQEPA